MAKSLSYGEALSKGLVYPGSEQEALKITGGGKGFADTEAFKKAFDVSYQAKKAEVDAITSEAKGFTDKLNEANKYYNLRRTDKNWKNWMGYLNQRDAVLKSTGLAGNLYSVYQRSFAANYATDRLVDKINQLNEKAKGLSGVMEQAMGKYKTASEQSIEVEKRETGAATAARKRLTRGTAGLLAKAGGAGGMVGTGLPELGTGVSGGLGLEGQLGRKMTL